MDKQKTKRMESKHNTREVKMHKVRAREEERIKEQQKQTKGQ